MTKYKNAYTEVYAILEQLDEEEYNQIPSEVITAIRENRNTEYEFELDEELELKEQELLPETKAKQYNSDLFANKQKVQSVEREHTELIKYKENIFKRIFNKIRQFFRV